MLLLRKLSWYRLVLFACCTVLFLLLLAMCFPLSSDSVAETTRRMARVALRRTSSHGRVKSCSADSPFRAAAAAQLRKHGRDRLNSKTIPVSMAYPPVALGARGQLPESEDGDGEKDDGAVTLLMVTKSAPGNFEKRNLARMGWLATGRAESECCCDQQDRSLCRPENTVCRHEQTSWTHRFLVGHVDLSPEDEVRLNLEQTVMQDIILYPQRDSYYKLTLKLVWLLRFLTRNVASDYVLLLDDDGYVQVWRVALWLSSASRHSVYAGHVKEPQTKVARYWWNKWQVTEKQYQPSHYPPYAVGGGIFLSRDVIPHAVKAADTWSRPWLPVEDAFLGVLLNFTSIRVQNIKQMYLNGMYKLMGCQGDFKQDTVQPLIVAGDKAYLWQVMELRAANQSLCKAQEGLSISLLRFVVSAPLSRVFVYGNLLLGTYLCCGFVVKLLTRRNLMRKGSPH